MAGVKKEMLPFDAPSIVVIVRRIFLFFALLIFRNWIRFSVTSLMCDQVQLGSLFLTRTIHTIACFLQ